MTVAVSRKSGDGLARNSRVELLRIVGIFLILLNHTLQSDILPLEAFPWSVVSRFLSRLGGVGDVIFFGITVYYLSMGKRSTIKGSLRRVWLLERQLLCYSIGLFVFTAIVWFTGCGFHSYTRTEFIWLFIQSCMPLLSAFWWYPSAYAVFLIAQPFLDRLLEAIGKRSHALLAGFLFVLLSIPIPQNLANLGWTPILFIYQYIVFSYAARYLRPSRHVLCLIVVTAALLGFECALVSGVTGNESMVDGYLNVPRTLIPMALGFSLVLLAVESESFSNKIINQIASCAFGAYLIMCYPSASMLISRVVGMLSGRAGGDWLLRLICELAVVFLVLIVAIVVDSLRQKVFQMTVDRRRGALFEKMYRWMDAQITSDFGAESVNSGDR